MTDRSKRFVLAQKAIQCGSYFLLIFLLWICPGCAKNNTNKDKILIGVIYSISEKIADLQRQMVNGIILAVEEINKEGGILGKQVELMIVDGKADPLVCKKAAEMLIKDKGAVAIFGGSSSMERKAMKPIIEKYNNVLFFCGNYEGLEVSNNIVYMTLCPNQQLTPAIYWSIQHIGSQYALIGLDDIYSHTVHEILKDYIFAFGGVVVGEAYVPFGEEDVESTVLHAALKNHPVLLINTLGEQHNVSLYEKVRELGFYSEDMSIISFWLTSNTAKDIGAGFLTGDYNIMDYFATDESESNLKFINAFQNRFGTTRNVDAFIERTYASVYIWRAAVNTANTTVPEEVLKYIESNGIEGPAGLIFIDDEQHPFKVVKIGKVGKEVMFDVEWDSKYIIAPENFPGTRSSAKWEEFQNDLYEKWGEKWHP